MIMAPCAPLIHAKDPAWVGKAHNWIDVSEKDPGCKAYYILGWVTPNPLGDQVQWDYMTKKQFEWYSKDGARKFPSICVTRHVERANYRILFAHGRIVSTYGTDTQTRTNTNTVPISGTVSDATPGSATYGQQIGTIEGTQTTTSVTTEHVPYSRNFDPYYVYVYGKDNTLIASDNMAFTYQTGGAGANNFGYNLGSAIGNSHRYHKMLEKTLDAIASSLR
jgi:hypothetical protein